MIFIKIIFFILFLLQRTSYCMDLTPKDTIASGASAPQKVIKNPEKYRRDIFFKTVATYKVGHENKLASTIARKNHPLMEGATAMPYIKGDKGLFDAKLISYELYKKALNDDLSTGVHITVEGHIRVSGLAPDFCEESNYQTLQGMSLLEAAILGAFKEHIHDRPLFKGNAAAFYRSRALSPSSLCRVFQQCIQREWTSSSQSHPATRCQEDNWLIQRYMPQIYRSSPHLRTGEYIRKQLLDGDNDPQAAVQLHEFNVEIGLSHKKHKKCLIQ